MLSPEQAIKLGISSKQGEHCHPKQQRSPGTMVINTGPDAIKSSHAANLIRIQYAFTNAIAYPHNTDLMLTFYFYIGLCRGREDTQSSIKTPSAISLLNCLMNLNE